jgi:hypothetical protein
LSDHSKVQLNSSEISSLWLLYLNNSLSGKMIKHFLNNVEDVDIKTQLQAADTIVNKHMKYVEGVFRTEGLTLPMGFSESDINEKAPRLFSDAFYLHYLSNMAKTGMADYSLTYYHAAREDIRKFYLDVLIEIDNFHFGLANIMLSKGVFIRSPIVRITKHADMIDRKDFLAGLFTQPRSLLLKEISNIFENMLTCITGHSLLMAFAQVAESNEVKKYLLKGKDMLTEQIDFLSKLLKDEDVPVASTADMFVTECTEAPFSDRLMLYHVSALNVSHFRNFANSIATSLRSDIIAGFTRLSVEIGKYASEGLDIMIKNGWMEQQPQLAGHRELVGV